MAGLKNPFRKRSASDYWRMLTNLLPRGIAWVRRQDSILGKTLGASAEELARLDALGEVLLTETIPSTTTQAIEDWELDLGLPDECLPSGRTLAERRAAVVAKLTDLGRQDRAYWISFAKSIGYDIDIINMQPFEAGRSDVGNFQFHIGPENIRYWWIVVVKGMDITWFRTGVSRCGDSLGRRNIAQSLECVMLRDKPAHTLLTFEYPFIVPGGTP